ncbi:MAG: sulfate adenylyltransferase subunit 1 [Planctomycetota bacterium]|jgi:sulfate adenylyltransferase large subunit
MDVLSFVIVGHVDHGKSTLIGRMLYDTDSLPPDKIEEVKKASAGRGKETEFAYLLDHLEEEREQGITIDTTQVFFKTEKRRYVIIDAPGHVEFVKNMITGASQAEAAVLIIDVAEGVKEQTKRHSYMLSLLGLHQVVVVLNKMDLVDFSQERFETVKQAVESWLASINIEPILYIPISAINGDNITAKSDKMPWYRGPAFIESLDSLQSAEAPEDKALIFPVQDVYKVDGKRITAGRIEAGVLKSQQVVKVLPSSQTTKVKSIEKFPSQADAAGAGESIGITTEDPLFLKRGDVVCLPEAQSTLTDMFDATMFWMSKRDFNKGGKITLRCATQETTAKVERINKRIDSSTLDIIEHDAGTLKNLEVGQVTIKTKTSIVIKPFNDVKELGRFVLVEGDNICAGGIIGSGEE